MFQLAPSANCCWVLGYRGVYRVPLSAISADGNLLPGYEKHLRALDQPPDNEPIWYHMTVVITTRCNLACNYCFQNTGPISLGPSAVPARIPVTTLDDDATTEILDFCRHQMAERGAERLDLMLFGGEPTLRLDQCLRFLHGAGQLGLANAAMISNGTRLGPDAAMALEQAGLRSIQVTLDGDLPVHDRIRTTVGGAGTFARIMRSLAQASSGTTTMRWVLRVNLTGESIGSADALIERLAGQLDPARFAIAFALIHDSSADFDDALTPSPALAKRVGGLYVQALEAGFEVNLPLLSKCGACGEFGGATGSVVNADGTLYSCWESIGKQGYEVGQISTGYATDEVIRPRWVTCGYEAANAQSEATDKAYRRTVDATILDWLYAAGRLSRPLVPANQ